jgi:hypothetical protein
MWSVSSWCVLSNVTVTCMNVTCSESKFVSTVWYFVYMDVLWIMCHSRYFVKYRLALCVCVCVCMCMDVLCIVCQSCIWLSTVTLFVYRYIPDNISQLLVLVARLPIEVSTADGSHSHRNWCTIYPRFLSVVQNILRNYYERREIQYNCFQASPVLRCTCGRVTSLERAGKATRLLSSISWMLWMGSGFRTTGKKHNYTRKLCSTKHTSVGNTLD